MRQLLDPDAEQRSEAFVDATLLTLAGDDHIGLVVDRVGDVVEVGEEIREAPPDTLQAQERELIAGVYKLEECLLMAPDAEKLVQRARAQTALENQE